MTTPNVPGYTLQQAQRDIAYLRGQITHLLATAALNKLTVSGGETISGGGLAVTGGTTTDTLHVSGVATAADGLVVDDISAPSATSNAASVYAASGNLKYVSGLASDGNAYNTGRLSLINSGQTITSTSGSPASVTNITCPVGDLTYVIEVYILYKGGTAAGTPGFQLNGPATSLTAMGNEFIPNGVAQTINTGQVTLGTSQLGPTFQTSPQQLIMKGFATFSSTGTLALTAWTSNASDSLIIVGAYMNIQPVA